MLCRICGAEDPQLFLSLGKTPLANNFVPEEHLDKEEPYFPLEECFCNNCKLVQLSYVVNPELMFKHYVYVSSTTKMFREHFTKMAEDLTKRFGLTKHSLAVDIGSNDGLLLKGFKNQGVKICGIEPADNLSTQANKEGIETLNEFFNEGSVKKIASRHGKADVVTANNVFAHIEDIHAVTENVKVLLKDDGIFVIEVAYLVDMMKNMTFDAIYHEHIYNYSLTPLVYFFEAKHGMKVFDVEHVATHGGSLRVYVKKQEGKWEVQSSVQKMLDDEKEFGIHDIKTYEQFAAKVNNSKEALVNYITMLKKQGKKIAGYGAPAKTTTLLHFCGLGKEHLDYIVDDNPLKAGLYTPGNHIPVVSSQKLHEDKPDYVLLLAWNFANEIVQKNKEHQERGVKFVNPFPQPMVVG